MTEKRFKRHLSFVVDENANGNDKLMTIREVIPMLNMLHEENRELRLSNLSMQTRLTEVAKITKEWLE